MFCHRLVREVVEKKVTFINQLIQFISPALRLLCCFSRRYLVDAVYVELDLVVDAQQSAFQGAVG